MTTTPTTPTTTISTAVSTATEPFSPEVRITELPMIAAQPSSDALNPPSNPPSKKYKTIDVMLDLETVGLCDNAVITQIAAVAFSMEDSAILEDFNQHIGIRNSVQKGLKIDGSSMEWWFKQPDKIYEDVFVKAMASETRLEDVLNDFTLWIKTLKEKYGIDYKSNVNVWGNGALADNKWIRQAYKVCNMEAPWAFHEDRDVRTIAELGRRLFNYEYRNTVFEGTVHNALDDCKHQIKYCTAIYAKIQAAKLEAEKYQGTKSEYMKSPSRACYVLP